jgi:hypothetical protein
MNRTPRDWLLARHAPARPALDALRRSVLPEPPLDLRGFLRELFVPVRHAWLLLGVFWVAGLLWAAAHRPAPAPFSEGPSAEQMALLLKTRSQLHALLSETGPDR